MLFFMIFQTDDVGPGRTFARIEDALSFAIPGTEIDVYPSPDNYKGTAILITKSGIKLIGRRKPCIDGSGFDYSGSGRTPRAIFQINPEATGVIIEGFELKSAHNQSHNGAGIRINGASDCKIESCSIHVNDMGIMSNGAPGDPKAASNQLIERCEIFKNGDFADPGYNHNLYLGGTSVTVQFCDIHDSLTGHNLKCRAHFAQVLYNQIHDSSNRELDFVESWDTTRPNSNVLLMGNIIRKNPDATGNRTVIHFGQERGTRDGTIFLINNEISTEFASPVLLMTSPTSSARLVNNVIDNFKQAHPSLVTADNGSSLDKVAGSTNVMTANYEVTGTRINTKSLFTDPRSGVPYGTRSKETLPFPPAKAWYMDGNGNRHDAIPAFRYDGYGIWIKATDPRIGAS